MCSVEGHVRDFPCVRFPFPAITFDLRCCFQLEFMQVSDFGLAKLSSDNYTHISTRVMGTFGLVTSHGKEKYFAPLGKKCRKITRSMINLQVPGSRVCSKRQADREVGHLLLRRNASGTHNGEATRRHQSRRLFGR